MLRIQNQIRAGKIFKCTIFVGVRRSDIFYWLRTRRIKLEARAISWICLTFDPSKVEAGVSLFCLFGLSFNVPVNHFSVMSGRSHRFLGITSTFGE